jgi:hypothetical protein
MTDVVFDGEFRRQEKDKPIGFVFTEPVSVGLMEIAWNAPDLVRIRLVRPMSPQEIEDVRAKGTIDKEGEDATAG